MIERNDYLKKLINLKDIQIIKVVTGIRRCGKSTLFELYKEYLLKNNVSENQIISLNFENPNIEELQDRKKLYTYIESKLIKDKMNYIFLDEIQNVKEFEKTVDGLFIMKNVDLYITSSNAYMLSSELATLLSGRYIEIKMLPLSFKEYLSAFDDKTDLSKKFNNYLTYSSFPQTIELANANIDNIDMYLESIFNTIIYKDVMFRKGIKEQNILESVVRYLYDNIGNTTSIKKITDTLISSNRPVSYNTIANYIDALVDSYILYKANRYDIKGKEYLKTNEKYYAVDIGLRQSLLKQKAGIDKGHILENVVYLELLRRGYKVFIGKIDNLEVDFIAKNSNETIYYQVSLTLRDENTLKRKLAPLMKINDYYPKYIITLDNDLEADYNGIRTINIIDWLLK